MPRAFLQSVEWPNATALSRDDILPLTADAVLDIALDFSGARGLNVSAKPTTRASYLADFGVVDMPVFGEMRARAGVRYSRLYPMGALELACRKEWRLDVQRGYNLFIGAQSVGDDKRLDALCEIGLLKIFRNARAFYRFHAGGGWVGSKDDEGWSEMGSSLGVTHVGMPPSNRGELTVGWRTRLFDSGPEDIARPARKKSRKRSDANTPLESTPYVSYSIDVPAPEPVSDASVTWAVSPQHDMIEHTARFTVPAGDADAGDATISATLEQAISNPLKCRLRIESSYTRR